METEKTERKIMLVEWIDITSSDSSWKEEEDALNWIDEQDSLVRQIGFLLDIDENYVSLLCSYFSGSLVGTITRIPKSAIQFMGEVEYSDFKQLLTHI